MRNQILPVAIACGLLTALLFLAPLSLGGLGVIASSFTALPLFVSVLGFGTLSGLISGAVSAIIIALFFGIVGSAKVSVVTLLPALWIGYLVGLKRDDQGYEEWYPIEAILVRMAALSLAAALLFGFLTGYTVEAGIAAVTQMMNDWAQSNPSFNSNPEAVALQARAIASLMPIAMPVSILILLVINLHLGARLARARGWMLRPKDDVPSTATLPLYAGAILVAALALSFLDGALGLAAKATAGAVGGAFALVGLATIHYLTRNNQMRGLLLSSTYTLALIFTLVVGPLLAAVGVAETLFQLRSRKNAPPPSI